MKLKKSVFDQVFVVFMDPPWGGKDYHLLRLKLGLKYVDDLCDETAIRFTSLRGIC